jgi:hypothetical protein
MLILCQTGCSDTSAAPSGAIDDAGNRATPVAASLSIDDLSAQLTAQLRGKNVIGFSSGETKEYGPVDRVRVSQFDPPHGNEAFRVDLEVIVGTDGGKESSRLLLASTALFRASDNHLVGSWRFEDGVPLTFVLTFPRP